MSNRRAFITLLGGAAAWPLAARAQQRAMPVVGFVGSDSPDRWATQVRAFQQGLREVGYVEGGNVAIEYRWAEGQNERLSGLVIDLLRRPVSVLAVPGTPAALAAKVASTMVPIVFAIGADPVQIGLVASLKQPGGNVTGVVTLNVEIAPKRLELLHELFPTATNFALLVNPTNPAVAEGYQKTSRRRLVRSGSSSMFCVRAAKRSSIRCSRPQPDYQRSASWSVPILSSAIGSSSSLH